jgi:hypothetical protein
LIALVILELYSRVAKYQATLLMATVYVKVRVVIATFAGNLVSHDVALQLTITVELVATVSKKGHLLYQTGAFTDA